MSKTNNGDDFELLYEAYTNPNKDVVNEREDYDDEDGKVSGEQDTGPDENELDSLKGLPRDKQIKKAVELINTKRYQVQDVMDVVDSNYRDDVLKQTRKSDTVEEGIFDRMKARAGAVKKSLGSTEDSYQTAKASSIVSTHLKKIDSELSRLATDMVKLGVMDESAAEKMAQGVSQRLRRQAELSPHKPDASTLTPKQRSEDSDM